MTAEDVATARWLISRVIRRWPLGSPEVADLRRAVALLAGEPRSSTVWEPKTAMNELEPEVTP